MNLPVPPTRPERALKWVLRLNGLVTLAALAAVFMPLDWMDNVHQRLGMGPMPRGPVVEYLARTVSALYAIHGGLCLILARDVRRYGSLITYIAFASLLFAALVFWIDKSAGLPKAWLWSEAVSIALMSGVMLVLIRVARASEVARARKGARTRMEDGG